MGHFKLQQTTLNHYKENFNHSTGEPLNALYSLGFLAELRLNIKLKDNEKLFEFIQGSENRGHVHYYEKVEKTKSGKTWIDTHKRKNRSKSKKTTYYPENLLYLYWNSSKQYKKLKYIKGFKPYHEIDPVIQYWLEYWKKRFKSFPNIDPLLIKAIIAKESSFRLKADPKVAHSTAYGLMQIVNTSRNALSKSIESSVSMEYIVAERSDLEDAVINIAVGIRWMVVKYFLLKKNKRGDINELIKAYYGNTDPKENDKYLNKVLEYYNNALPPRSKSK